MKNPLSKRVQIDVSLARPHSTREEYPRLVVFGIVPYGAPIISEIAPNSMIRRSSTTVDGPYVEQVRLSSILQGKLLPGLHQNSRLRDSLQSILTSGAKEVDFILARKPETDCWQLDDADMAGMFVGYLNINQGAICVFPDAGGPWPRSIEYTDENLWTSLPKENNRNLPIEKMLSSDSFEEEFSMDSFYQRVTNIRNVKNIYSTYLSDNFQIALLDFPFSYTKFLDPLFCEQELPQILHSLQGGDFLLCSWTGSFIKLQQHGWRCASAFVGGYLAAREDILTQSIVGHSFFLGGGRNITIERSSKLGGSKHKSIPSRLEDHGMVVEISSRRGKDYGQILSEISTRRPNYEWPLPVLRTVKAIHQALTRASELFVFRPVKEVEAISFKNALEMVLTPFYNLGIVVGPNGEGTPQVSAVALPDYTEPMLSADLSAQIRPWCQNISLRVMVKSGSQPQIEGLL
jgi:hypothetical protein